MIKAIIVDDERKARLLLSKLLEKHCGNIEILSLATSVEEAIAAIHKHKPEIVFLDVEMPVSNGFELLGKLDVIDFQVIFTTAYEHYAIQAIKFSALDYLLKPIDIDELKEAVSKITIKVQSKEGGQDNFSALLANLKSEYKKVAVPHRKGVSFINLNEIISCHADKNYTVLKLLEQKQVVSTRSLGEYEELLASANFIRVHHSHIINIKYVREYLSGEGGYIIMTDDSEIEISRRRKNEFLKILNQAL